MREVNLSGLVVDISQYLLMAVDEAAFNAVWMLVQDNGLAAHLASGPSVQTRPKSSKPPQANLAQIEIRGMMTKNGSSLSDAGSTTLIRQEIRAAMKNPDIDGVLILIDSPGGTVSGQFELASDLESLSNAKPTITLFEDQGTSAALWAGVMSSKVYANTEHAMIGSLGTYMGLYDYSGMAEQKGIKPVLIRTGDLKGAGFPGTEITDEQKANLQAWVDQAHSAFSSTLQRRRNLSKEQMAELSKGGIYSAKAAMKLGLIDGIRDYPAAVAELRGMVATRKGRRMSESNGPSAASLPELEAACRGASEGFLIGQLRKGATASAASGEWMNSLVADNKELTSKLKASEDALKAAQDENAKLKTDLEAAKKGKPGGESGSHAAFRGIPTGGGSASDSNESATSRFNEKVSAKVAGGMEKSKAIAAVVKSDPELHQAYVNEVNAGRATQLVH